jgi:hypothetical protein
MIANQMLTVNLAEKQLVTLMSAHLTNKSYGLFNNCQASLCQIIRHVERLVIKHAVVLKDIAKSLLLMLNASKTRIVRNVAVAACRLEQRKSLTVKLTVLKKKDRNGPANAIKTAAPKRKS